jgi:hypothetical protein
MYFMDKKLAIKMEKSLKWAKEGYGRRLPRQPYYSHSTFP